jgi:hypothetical protein
MVKKLLPLFFLLISFNTFAQQNGSKLTIKGVVTDSVTAGPLGFVTVILKEQKTGKPVKSMLTKEDGSFELTALAGEYNLALVYIGYRPKTILVAGGRPVADLGKILLAASSKQLNEVAVTADRPVLTKEIDRVSYDVQADPESKSNDALEMLRKVPMITVDGNDIIQLKGSTSFQIFINGKPSALMVNNPSDVLKAIPAATIKKIEVITVPPSKYDGEGLAGIINIITLEKHEEGINGSIFGRYNSVFGERSSASLNIKKDKLGVNMLFGLGHQPVNTLQSGSDLATFSPATDLSQQGTVSSGGNFDNGRTDMSYEADSLDLFTGTFDFVSRRFSSDPSFHSQLLIQPDSLAQAYQLTSFGITNTGALDAGFNYQRGFRQNRNELLTFSYQYSYTSSKQVNDVAISNAFNYSGSDHDQQNSADTRDHTFQADFVDPVKNLVIEAGTKMIFRTNESNFGEQDLDKTTGTYVVDTTLTNQFNYHQNVYSVYNTYQLKIKDWTFKAGTRMEYTVITTGLSSGSSFPGQHYVNVMPAVSVQRSYKENGIVSLGFAERIERPGIKQLNPFVDRSNPDFIVTGNPQLRPVVNHIFELSYSKFGNASFSASLNYSFASNTVQNVTTLVSDTLSRTTYINAGKDQNAGINVSANYPLTNKLTFNVNAQIAHMWITGVYNSQLYKTNGYTGNALAFARYTFNSELNASLNEGYNSGNLFLQGKTSDYVYTSLNIIKDFLNKRFTGSLTIYDPFIKYRDYTSYSRTPDFAQSNFTQEYYRNIRLALNYKFGKLKNGVTASKRSIKNDDVKSGSNGGEN